MFTETLGVTGEMIHERVVMHLPCRRRGARTTRPGHGTDQSDWPSTPQPGNRPRPAGTAVTADPRVGRDRACDWNLVEPAVTGTISAAQRRRSREGNLRSLERRGPRARRNAPRAGAALDRPGRGSREGDQGAATWRSSGRVLECGPTFARTDGSRRRDLPPDDGRLARWQQTDDASRGWVPDAVHPCLWRDSTGVRARRTGAVAIRLGPALCPPPAAGPASHPGRPQPVPARETPGGAGRCRRRHPHLGGQLHDALRAIACHREANRRCRTGFTFHSPRREAEARPPRRDGSKLCPGASRPAEASLAMWPHIPKLMAHSKQSRPLPVYHIAWEAQ